ncbi:hypothetical protein [Nonomuraea sp. NPDC050202]|uniref:hypothetical protein n=1 Tax=Nonomuraea sp. NPDC050202 TaxID=3155035 RepID=UPI00340AD979
MVAVLVAVAALAGCGIADTGVLPAGEPARGGLTTDSSSLLRVYFVTPEGTWPVSRPAPAGDRLQHAMDALLAGPTAAERGRGLVTELPPASRRVRARTAGGRVELRLPWLVRDLRPVAVSQLVCTAAAGAGDTPGAATDAGDAPTAPTAAAGTGDATVIEVFEPGMTDHPWPVRCDASGSAVPAAPAGSS